MRRYAAVLARGAVLTVKSWPAHALDVARHPELETFIHELSRTHGFSKHALDSLFARARLRPEIIQAMERPKEALPWYEYRKLFVTEERVRQAWRSGDGTCRHWRAQHEFL